MLPTPLHLMIITERAATRLHRVEEPILLSSTFTTSQGYCVRCGPALLHLTEHCGCGTASLRYTAAMCSVAQVWKGLLHDVCLNGCAAKDG